MYFLALGELPDSWYEVVFLPVFLAAVGGAIWIAGRRAEVKDNAKPWKWAAAIPFFLALASGWDSFWKIRDTFYDAALQGFGKKMQIAHYAAFLVPVACIVGLGVWELVEQRITREE